MAGGAAAAGAVRRIRARAFTEAKAAVVPLLAAHAKNAQRVVRHQAAVNSIDRGLASSKKLIPTALRSLRSQANHTGAELRQHMTANAEPFEIEPGHVVWASLDAHGERALREHAEDLDAKIADLRENGRPPRRVPVTASMQAVSAHTRKLKRRPKIIWPDEAAIRQDVEAGHLADSGIHTMEDLNRRVLQLGRKRRATALQGWGLPMPTIAAPKRATEVTGSIRVIPAHARVVEGYPGKAGRKALAAAVRQNLWRRDWDWRETEAIRAGARMAATRSAARAEAAPALRTLAMLGRRSRLGLILGGAALGAAAVGTLAGTIDRRLHKTAGSPALAKADKTDAPPDSAEQVFRAGTRVEDRLAAQLGRAFGAWTRLPLDELSTRAAALRTTLMTSIDRAMTPLDAAVRGGAGATVPASAPDDAGEPKALSFSLDTGSQKVVDFAQANRLKLAGDMADEQLQTVRTVLHDAALQGQAPAVTARMLRQTIGLAPSQAQHVINYRRQLETLDPNALNRALRDARFDPTVTKAVETKTPLAPGQIDRMVDAYHRRYLAYRAMTIARTEGLKAANNGHVAAVQDFLDGHPGFTVIKTWIATEDEHTRADHHALDGQKVIGLHTPFRAPSGDMVRWPHDPNAPARQVVNCFAPETPIEGRVLLAMRAKYVGPMREIITRSGARLRVTVKHPVLTPEGFRVAGSLQKGGYVLSRPADVERLGTIANQVQNAPASAEEVFKALRLSGVLTCKLVAEDLYGDMLFGQGDVEVVATSRILLRNLEAAFAERRAKLVLSHSAVRKALSPRARPYLTPLDGIALPSSRRLGGLDLAPDTIGFEADGLPFEPLRIGSAANIDASRHESANQGRSADADFICELLHGCAGQIAPDEIIEIRDYAFSGHVYDVQTTLGWILAGGIVSSNCRCTLGVHLVPRTAAALHGFSLVADAPGAGDKELA